MIMYNVYDKPLTKNKVYDIDNNSKIEFLLHSTFIFTCVHSFPVSF